MIPKFSQFKKINETINKDSYETIEQSLNDFEIQNYEIIQENGKFIVNVNGNVKLRDKNLNRIPFNFGIVSGDFDCSHNRLTSLEGAPNEVGEDFDCGFNQLTSLEGAPSEIGKSFYCSNNKLTSLEGAPSEIGGDFDCSHNRLTSLEGAPNEVGGDFYCGNNPIKFTEEDVENIKIGGGFKS